MRSVVGLDAELARQRIERDLQREAHARAGDAAIGKDRRLVGGHRIHAAAVVREVVEARQDRADLSGLQAGRERIGGIGTGIDGRLAVERQQPALGIGIGGENVVVLAAVGIGGQALAPVLDPAQRDARACASPTPARPPRAAGCPCSRSRRRHRATPRGSGLRRCRGIRRGPSARCAAAGWRWCTMSCPSRECQCGDHAAALDRAHDLPRGAQLARHRDGGLGLHGLEVHVGRGGEIEVVAPVLVHQRRARLARGQHVGDRRQRIEIDLDLGGQVLGLGARRRHAHRYQLADVAHLARGQHRLHRRLEARQRGVGADRRRRLRGRRR